MLQARLFNNFPAVHRPAVQVRAKAKAPRLAAGFNKQQTKTMNNKLEELKAQERQSWDAYQVVKTEHEKIESVLRSKWCADHYLVRREEERIELRKELLMEAETTATKVAALGAA